MAAVAKTHYHASALGGGMPMARAVFPRAAQARSFLLSLFSRLPEREREKLSRRLKKRSFAACPPAYVLLVEECDSPACHPGGH
ncbi:MAG: hypothetical protein RMK67_02540 [Chloroflexota bacterium]|nr:hypothetical protein [Chloroflexota bacterium]